MKTSLSELTHTVRCHVISSISSSDKQIQIIIHVLVILDTPQLEFSMCKMFITAGLQTLIVSYRWFNNTHPACTSHPSCVINIIQQSSQSHASRTQSMDDQACEKRDYGLKRDG